MVPTTRRLLISLGVVALLAGCASEFPGEGGGGGAPKEYLDEQTGATISSVERALVFARERIDRAANARDYVNLLGVVVNRGGRREYVMVGYLWSTLDTRFEAATPKVDSLVLVADDRQILLSTNGKTPAELGIGKSIGAPPRNVVKPVVFPTDLATLGFIAAARNLQVRVTLPDGVVNYELWDDQRKSLDRFVRFLNGEP
jgi:hypothetical protein